MSIIAQFNFQIISGFQFVSINLVDSVTGKPANGNNIAISYSQTINGVTTYNTVNIPGTGVQIYKTSVPEPTNSWQILNQSAIPDPAPPVNQCDLVINFITVDKPESSPGAYDAQVTVSASSSYLPIQYSKDNITFQDSNVFTGLEGGVLTIYVKDANTQGCNLSQAVTIPVTQNLLTADPSITLTGSNISRWNAAFNPIVFTYQRKDFGVTGISLDTLTGNAKVAVNGDMSAISTAITTNQTVIANAAAQGITILNYQNIYIYLNAGAYVGVFMVNSVDGNSLIINTPYTSSATGYANINMLRPYYKVFTNITYVDPLTSAITTITSVNRPNAAGITTADISNLLQSLLRAKDDSDYTQINFRDSNLSASYTIQYAESYDDGSATGKTSLYITIAQLITYCTPPGRSNQNTAATWPNMCHSPPISKPNGSPILLNLLTLSATHSIFHLFMAKRLQAGNYITRSRC